METTHTPATTNGHPLAPVHPAETFNVKEIVQTLQGLMMKVTAEECNAQNVMAACSCASRIVDVLRLHLEAERFKASQQLSQARDRQR